MGLAKPGWIPRFLAGFTSSCLNSGTLSEGAEGLHQLTFMGHVLQHRYFMAQSKLHGSADINEVGKFLHPPWEEALH